MSATTNRRAVGRKLRELRRSEGNFRLKGLLLALSDGVTPEDVGRAWPRRRPQTDRDYVALGERHGATQENSVARELYDSDAVHAGEVVPRDEYIARALTSGLTDNLDVIWREELLESAISGAETRKIARDATTVTEVGAKRGDLPTPGQQPFASTGTDGASAPFNEEDYSQTAYDCEKHEIGFAIEEELIDQAEIDAIERQIEYGGGAVENAINRQLLLNVVDNAGQDHNTAGNDANPIDLFEAMENVSDNDFDPVDSWIVHPEFRTEVADEGGFAGVNWTGAGTVDQDNGIYGVRVFVGSGATYNGLSNETPGGSNTWGWEAADEIGAVVFGSQFVHTAVYQDIRVSELEPPITAIQDIRGGVARAWTDSVQADDNAISTVTQ